MQRKLFPLDKNYILQEAQAASKPYLLNALVEKVKACYLRYCNPLGLEDDTVLKIKNCIDYDTHLLADFYEHLAGIYRFKYGSNQLEFIFDGRSHLEKYQEEWEAAFMGWVLEFCSEENFLKAILEVTIFYPKGRKALLAGNRLKVFIAQQFYMKVYKRRGIVPLKRI